MATKPTAVQTDLNSAADANVSFFHSGWLEWLASNLMKGVDRKKIIDVMQRKGFSPSFSEGRILEILSSPIFRAGEAVFRSERKLLTLFSALSALYRQSRYAEGFSKCAELTADEFYSRFYYANRPVVVQGLMKGWRAIDLWKPEFFAEKFGECEVEITKERAGDPYYEDNFGRHRSAIRMKDFVKLIREGGETNDYYLVAKNYLLSRSEFQILFDHFTCPEGFLDPSQLRDRVKLWFGPKGTVTPLHHDACNILLGQIYGRKRVMLISPFDIAYVYNDRECFSAVNLEEIDYSRFPLMKWVSIIDVTLEPGDFVLLPIGWWHWVKSLDISISLSFTNFCVEQPTIWGYRY